MKLLVLVDTLNYAFNEIYQQHLHPILQQSHECTYVELNSLQCVRNVSQYDHVFSALKLRTLLANVHHVKRAIGDVEITVQDYDPWVSYEDVSPYRGAYEKINNALSVKNFMVSSVEWANFIKEEKKLPVFGIQLGVSRDMCKFTPWENRSKEIEFRGSHREYRQRNFNKLADMGLRDIWKKGFINPYSAFLTYLDDLKIWLQFEGEPIVVDGVAREFNGLWPKAIEILSRGCFLVRNRQREAYHYEIEKFPTAILVDKIEEIPEKIEWVKSLSNDTKNEMILDTVNRIKNKCYYETIVTNLTKHIVS